ncbi:MAG: NAD(P)(+) transhydrogenase (Re/Si-specific) subunit beta [Planctomycetes bacterium]|nr:NAD(P)(+) transhydrogenase (Re/Si-specific) subunit beta [Planctomycetota bacterium]
MFVSLLDSTIGGREVFSHLLYLASIIMFMLGIMRLGKVKTAANGNRLAMAAMLVAVIGQFVEMGSINPIAIIIGLVIGTLIGGFYAYKVKMTEMPEMVALFNGFGGLASTLVALTYWGEEGGRAADALKDEAVLGPMVDIIGGGSVGGIALILSILIGSVTFTGSLVAWGKLNGKISGKPIQFTMHQGMNFILISVSLVLGAVAVWASTSFGSTTFLLLLITVLTLVLGAMLVLPIGGGDMPVVISLLNSYSGVAASMAGFAINSPVLIVSGSLVGASGLILTNVMCKAMNRSLANVLFGGFGGDSGGSGGGGGGGEYVGVKSADPESAAMLFDIASSCVIVPGYGMAVAQAQHAVRELGELLEAKGCKVKYAIHPVAGRMPGHMNVLLAEANVPYDSLFEMDQINSDFKNTSVALVIGANDVVNPAALTDKSSPIYGMPILNVHESQSVFVIKRSLGAGFAGIKNTLFEAENTTMIYGDAKAVVEEMVKALKSDD